MSELSADRMHLPLWHNSQDCSKVTMVQYSTVEASGIEQLEGNVEYQKGEVRHICHNTENQNKVWETWGMRSSGVSTSGQHKTRISCLTCHHVGLAGDRVWHLCHVDAQVGAWDDVGRGRAHATKPQGCGKQTV